MGVRLATHTSALGHGRDAVGGQRLLLAVSPMLRLHHRVRTVLLLLLLTARRIGEIGTPTARLGGRREESRRWTEKDKRKRDGVNHFRLHAHCLCDMHAIMHRRRRSEVRYREVTDECDGLFSTLNQIL